MKKTLRGFSAPASILVVLCAGLLWASVAQAGAWTQEEGNGYAKVWGRALLGSAAYFADGEVRDLDDSFTDLTLNLYGEYGVADGWTLLAAGAPLGFASSAGESTLYSEGGVLGVRRRILGGSVPLAFEARYGYRPGVGEKVLVAGQVEGNPYAYIPTVESHTADGELQIGMGTSWGWVTGSFGARFYSRERIDPTLLGNFQIGTRVGSSVVLDFHVFMHEPLGDVEVTEITGAGQTRYLGLGFGGSWWFVEDWGVNLGLDGVVYAASNAATPSIMLGLEHKYGP